MSEYQRGCYDGLDSAFRGNEANGMDMERLENYKNNVCTTLEDKRVDRQTRRALPRER